MASNAMAARPVRGFMADQAFFTRFAIGLSLFIVLAFGIFALSGLGAPGPAPLAVHVHAGMMLTWLAMYISQSSLISARQIALHRRLGWISLGVGVAAITTGAFAGFHAVDTGRVPPFFTNSFFLALSVLGSIVFAVVVGMAIARRKQIEWHRRLMIGSGVLVTEPAFGRLVPLPLTGQNLGELIILGLQLLVVGIIARHDRKILGRVHPATLVITLALVVHHLGLELLHRVPAWAALADSIAAG